MKRLQIFVCFMTIIASVSANETSNMWKQIAAISPFDIFDGIPSAISASGRFLAYGLWEDGSRKIRILDIQNGTRVILTPNVGSRTNYDWSPDEEWIAFADRSEKRKGIWIVSAKDGKEKQIYSSKNEEIVSHPRWVNNQKLIFSIREGSSGSVWAIKSDGNNLAQIGSGQPSYIYPALSPDEKQIAYGSETKLCISAVHSNEKRCLEERLQFGTYGRTEWSADGGTIYFVAAYGTDSVLHAWSISTTSGELQRIDNLDQDVTSISELKDGSLAIFSYDPQMTIGTVPSSGGTPVPARPKKQFFGFFPSWSPDGNKLAFISGKWNRIGFPHRMDIGVLDRNNDGQFGEPKVLLAEDMEDYGAVWSPDGRWLAFHSHRGNTDDIYLRKVSDSKSPPIALSKIGFGHETSSPSWSPDGRHLIFCSIPKESPWSRVFELEIDQETGQIKSEQRELTLNGFEGHAWSARYSPDGKTIAFCGRLKNGKAGVFTIPETGGTVSTVITHENGEDYGSPEWSKDGASLYFASSQGAELSQIMKVSATGGVAQSVTAGPISSMHPSLSPDGKTLAVTLFNAQLKVWISQADSSEAK